MDKIYRRSTQFRDTPKKKKNEKNRVRNTIMNFRVSPSEKDRIEERIQLTGLTKVEFFIQSCLYQAILVKGNIKTFSTIKEKMADIYEVIDKNPNLEDLDSNRLEDLKTILEILDRLFGKNENKTW